MRKIFAILVICVIMLLSACQQAELGSNVATVEKREIGVITEALFDIVSLNNKQVNKLRFGAGNGIRIFLKEPNPDATSEQKLYLGNVGILGDSYSTYEGYIPHENLSWYNSGGNVEENDVAKVEQTWWYQLIANNNAYLTINDSYSGSTICTVCGMSMENFITQC